MGEPPSEKNFDGAGLGVGSIAGIIAGIIGRLLLVSLSVGLAIFKLYKQKKVRAGDCMKTAKSLETLPGTPKTVETKSMQAAPPSDSKKEEKKGESESAKSSKNASEKSKKPKDKDGKKDKKEGKPEEKKGNPAKKKSPYAPLNEVNPDVMSLQIKCYNRCMYIVSLPKSNCCNLIFVIYFVVSENVMIG